MKKSSSITLTLMASMALVSCGQSRRCADPAGQIVPDSMCRGPAIIPGYHWIYGGRAGMTSRTGSGVRGGTSGSESGVSRGGFGAHGEGSSGAHASSGGHASGGSGS
ncbi:MAG: hypothetical protein LC796_15365 [Acidobacteria bacterium]|nr:hypothetical protein [Acidobacteriota bacterium]MCA1609272.1 hypothetical protein [Acidobacteriota bacterium]